MEEKENLIVVLTTSFSIKILKYCQTLNQEKHFHLSNQSVSYTHLRAHETVLDLVCRLLLEQTKNNNTHTHTKSCSTTHINTSTN